MQLLREQRDNLSFRSFLLSMVLFYFSLAFEYLYFIFFSLHYRPGYLCALWTYYIITAQKLKIYLQRKTKLLCLDLSSLKHYICCYDYLMAWNINILWNWVELNKLKSLFFVVIFLAVFMLCVCVRRLCK